MKKLILILTGSLIATIALSQDAFYKGAFIGTESFGPEFNKIYMSFWPMEGNAFPKAIYMFSATNINLYGEYSLSDNVGIGLTGNFDNFNFNERTPYITEVPLVSNASVAALLNVHLIQSTRYDVFLGVDYGFSQMNYYMNAQSADISGDGTWGDGHLGARVYFGPLGIELSTAASMANYGSLSSNKPVPGEYIPSKWSDIGYSANIGLCYKLL